MSGRVNTQIAELDIQSMNTTSTDALTSDHISGYAAYDNNTLARAVFVNLKAFLTTTLSPRASEVIGITIPPPLNPSPKLPKSMRVRRLVISHADDTAGLTFGGRTYETSGGCPTGEDKFENVPYGRGVTISDTEAVFITFQY